MVMLKRLERDATKADLAAVASFPPEIYRFPALAEVTDALKYAGLSVSTASERANEPVLILAEKGPPQTAAEGSQPSLYPWRLNSWLLPRCSSWNH